MEARVTTRHPVAVRGQLDAELSRWRWLVKWFLVIPHVIVLAGLWLVFAVLTVIAGASIALTGTYPRRIFDFNVGVLRWTWRVQFYAFTLGTDRYPPFTMEAVEDYPARLDVDYPVTLSRGLVWVKWWLLAIPHYLIVAALTGGIGVYHVGVISILCLAVGVVLAVKGQYPRGLFDVVMGLCRWCWRVTTYAALMRDEYPPFRVDLGPDEVEPAAHGSVPPAPTPVLGS